MLPLVGQKLSLLVPGQGTSMTAVSAIAAQMVMVPMSVLAGARADAWGRKPLLLLAFAALALRGVLYTLWDHPGWLVAVQLLDGVGAGLFGALFAVVVADLTRGTGRFNAAQGAVATAQAAGGVASTTLAGLVAARAGYDAAFLALAAIAAAGAALFWLAMPETRPAPGGRPRPSRPGERHARRDSRVAARRARCAPRGPRAQQRPRTADGQAAAQGWKA
jgi:MFS family permease